MLFRSDNADATKLNPKLAEDQRQLLAGSPKGVAVARTAPGGVGMWITDNLNKMSASTGLKYEKQTLDEEADVDAGMLAVPGGVEIGNVWDRYANPLYDSMIRTYQDVFDDLYILDSAGIGNRIFLALPRKLSLTQLDLATRARRVSSDRRFRFDMGDAAGHGFQHLRAPAQPGHAFLMRQDFAGKKIAQIQKPRDFRRGRARQHVQGGRGLQPPAPMHQHHAIRE